MTITVAKLHRLLGEIIDLGDGRKPVCIDKSTFTHPLEGDGCTIIGIEFVDGPLWICNADDEGGVKENADGSESGRMTVVLKGGSQ